MVQFGSLNVRFLDGQLESKGCHMCHYVVVYFQCILDMLTLIYKLDKNTALRTMWCTEMMPVVQVLLTGWLNLGQSPTLHRS